MMLTLRAFNLWNTREKAEWGINIFTITVHNRAEKSEDKRKTNVDKTVMHSRACTPIHFPALVSILHDIFFIYAFKFIQSLVAEKISNNFCGASMRWIKPFIYGNREFILFSGVT